VASAPSTPPRKWILVVDDDANVRQLWIDALRSDGYATVGTEDGIGAAELIRDLFPDLIVLDLRMPRMSGWDFLEVLRANPRWQKIPVLIVSGHLADRPPPARESLRIVGRMAKPVGLQELRAKIREAIGPARPAAREGRPR